MEVLLWTLVFQSPDGYELQRAVVGDEKEDLMFQSPDGYELQPYIL